VNYAQLLLLLRLNLMDESNFVFEIHLDRKDNKAVFIITA